MATGGDDSTPGEPRPRAWLRAASDRVPTRWFAAIGTGLFLAVTAAFGGLATVPEPEIAVIQPGDEHRNDQLSITIERAVLLDEFPEAGVYVEDDEDVLAIQVGVENQWTEALSAGPSGSVAKTVRVAELADTQTESVARYDDATTSPWLQPGVPAEIVITWVVTEGAFAGGDELHLTLDDFSLYTGSFVTTGQTWQDPVPAAALTLEIQEPGASR